MNCNASTFLDTKKHSARYKQLNTITICVLFDFNFQLFVMRIEINL